MAFHVSFFRDDSWKILVALVFPDDRKNIVHVTNTNTIHHIIRRFGVPLVPLPYVILPGDRRQKTTDSMQDAEDSRQEMFDMAGWMTGAIRFTAWWPTQGRRI